MSTRLVKNDCPSEVSERLKCYGGTNIYGRPIWRVCLAQDRLKVSGGDFFTAFKDDNPFDFGPPRPAVDKNGNPILDRFGRQVSVSDIAHHKVSRKSEYHRTCEIPMYPCRGWILERWMPPHIFGSRLDWETAKAADGITRIHGDFPTEGDYWMLLGPWPSVPSMGDLESAIQQYECDMGQMPTNLEEYMRAALQQERDEEEARFRKFEEDIDYFYRNEIAPIINGLSLDAQRVRNDVQAQLGLSSHWGAGT